MVKYLNSLWVSNGLNMVGLHKNPLCGEVCPLLHQPIQTSQGKRQHRLGRQGQNRNLLTPVRVALSDADLDHLWVLADRRIPGGDAADHAVARGWRARHLPTVT
jgi:hypothetical protein